MLKNYNKAYFFKIDTTLKKIRNYIQKELIKGGLDLTVDQWVVMDHLIKNPGISQITLGKLTFKDPPTITRILDLMVKKGLVMRTNSSNDRRKFSINVTEEGGKVYKKAHHIVRNIRKLAWNDLDEDDYETLVKIMDTIYNNMAEDS